MTRSLQLLDCTLRDGGYVNDWKWGIRTARDIVRLLTESGVDVVEEGFLRNIEHFDEKIATAESAIAALTKELGEEIRIRRGTALLKKGLKLLHNGELIFTEDKES